MARGLFHQATTNGAVMGSDSFSLSSSPSTSPAVPLWEESPESGAAVIAGLVRLKTVPYREVRNAMALVH